MNRIWRTQHTCGRCAVPMADYAKWYTRRKLVGSSWSPLPSMPNQLREHAVFAQRVLSRAGMQISGTMRKHQLKIPDRQCRMSMISSRLQDAIVILVTSLYAAKSDDETTAAAADGMCRELRRRITGEKPTDRDFRQVTELGQSIVEQGWGELREVRSEEILMPYK